MKFRLIIFCWVCIVPSIIDCASGSSTSSSSSNQLDDIDFVPERRDRSQTITGEQGLSASSSSRSSVFNDKEFDSRIKLYEKLNKRMNDFIKEGRPDKADQQRKILQEMYKKDKAELEKNGKIVELQKIFGTKDVDAFIQGKQASFGTASRSSLPTLRSAQAQKLSLRVDSYSKLNRLIDIYIAEGDLKDADQYLQELELRYGKDKDDLINTGEIIELQSVYSTQNLDAFIKDKKEKLAAYQKAVQDNKKAIDEFQAKFEKQLKDIEVCLARLEKLMSEQIEQYDLNSIIRQTFNAQQQWEQLIEIEEKSELERKLQRVALYNINPAWKKLILSIQEKVKAAQSRKLLLLKRYEEKAQLMANAIEIGDFNKADRLYTEVKIDFKVIPHEREDLQDLPDADKVFAAYDLIQKNVQHYAAMKREFEKKSTKINQFQIAFGHRKEALDKEMKEFSLFIQQPISESSLEETVRKFMNTSLLWQDLKHFVDEYDLTMSLKRTAIHQIGIEWGKYKEDKEVEMFTQDQQLRNYVRKLPLAMLKELLENAEKQYKVAYEKIRVNDFGKALEILDEIFPSYLILRLAAEIEDDIAEDVLQKIEGDNSKHKQVVESEKRRLSALQGKRDKSDIEKVNLLGKLPPFDSLMQKIVSILNSDLSKKDYSEGKIRQWRAKAAALNLWVNEDEN